jgi:pimeloyl-ACP methyl ester carboxylesterase
MKEKIIILHGIFRTHRSMRGLANFLERSGYNVLNLRYPSTKYDIEKLADIAHPQIADFISKDQGRTHFIGHSMGGLLIRAYLKKYRPINLGRVVMIGVPNRGSEVADFLKNFYFYKKLYGPAGQQLITNQEKFAHIFCDIDFEIGVIAGNRSIDPISSKIIGKTNDGKVSLESALIEGAKDSVIISSSHTFFPSNRKMWAQALSFIKTRKFTS